MAEILHLFSFAGRAKRSEYWGVQLFVAVCSVIVTIATGQETLQPTAATILLAFTVASTWIGLAVTIRRLHDLNRTGWWLLGYYLVAFMLIIPLLLARPREIDLIAVLAIIGVCMNIGLHVVWLGFFRGTPGPNQFGPEPPTAEEQLFSEQLKPRCPISGKGVLEKMSDRAAYRVISPKTLNTLYCLTD